MKAISSIAVMFSIVVSIISANLIYPMTAMVTDVNYDTNIVTIETVSGVEWQFEGCEDWDVGDLAECIMWSNDTKIIYDDVCLAELLTEVAQWLDFRAVLRSVHKNGLESA